MNKSLLLLIVTLIFASCVPSASAISTAIMQTQVAASTSTPTSTPTITPTSTSTITPTPDLRIIEGDPFDFQIKQTDLPLEGKYYIPDETWLHGSPNQEIIAGRGIEKGKEYVESTGRIMGFWVDHLRGTIAAALPEEVYCDIAFFKTSAGALLAETKYNYPTVLSPEAGWVIKDLPNQIGDFTVASEIVDNSKNRVWRQISFAFRNVTVNVLGYGMDSDVQWDFLESLARIELAKLQEAPLSLP